MDLVISLKLSLSFSIFSIPNQASASSQFSNCPLHSRRLTDEINHIHERALCIVYRHFSASLEGLLLKDKPVTIDNQNLQQLAVEILKVKTEPPQF